ncbi:MAG: hypothetical protein QOK29_2118 [Rhodospirillaceae bacterium]|nr:hypothetical protein [Rhodospirillaceae bacterium]
MLAPDVAAPAVALGPAEGDQFSLRVLRHTCASRLVQNHVALLVANDWLRHKALTRTIGYAHRAPKNLLDAARVLEVA